MKEVYDSLEDWPKVTLQDVSEPLTKFHPGETEVIVQLSARNSLSFFLNDHSLEQLAHAIVCRQKVRRLQKAEEIRKIENADGHLPGKGNRR